MGYQLTDMEVKELIVDVDYDHSGQIGFDEFSQMVNAVKRKVLRKKIEPKARSAFDRLDSDGSGALNRKELEIAFRSMGRKITKQQLDEFLSKVDKGGEGDIEYEEFLEMLVDMQIERENKVKQNSDSDQSEEDDEPDLMAALAGEILPEPETTLNFDFMSLA